jgi:hypothetical protein
MMSPEETAGPEVTQPHDVHTELRENQSVSVLVIELGMGRDAQIIICQLEAQFLTVCSSM